MEEKLKPCPFCGENEQEYSGRDDAQVCYDTVRCRNCGAVGEHCSTKEQARECWNTRSVDKELDEMRKARKALWDLYTTTQQDIVIQGKEIERLKKKIYFLTRCMRYTATGHTMPEGEKSELLQFIKE